MPELPEVETTRRGIEPHILGQSISQAVVRNHQLRYPIEKNLPVQLQGQYIRSVSRRGKYLLLELDQHVLMIHLGMSGSLRIVPVHSLPQKHDHFDLVFDKKVLRYRDPRRFGLILLVKDDPQQHKLLANLGPEPLSDTFNTEYLYQQSRGRKVAIKNLIMNSHVVVGVGNIYANEALFSSRIRPTNAAGRLSKPRLARLVTEIKDVLDKAIQQGGTTLRDFQQEDGKPGYFAQQLKVYGKAGKPCPECGEKIRTQVIGQRSSFYCRHCQKLA